MADGHDNLIPFPESGRRKEEVREINARGGRNSAKARREKKAISQLASAMIYSQLDGKGKDAIKKQLAGLRATM